MDCASPHWTIIRQYDAKSPPRDLLSQIKWLSRCSTNSHNVPHLQTKPGCHPWIVQGKIWQLLNQATCVIYVRVYFELDHTSHWTCFKEIGKSTWLWTPDQTSLHFSRAIFCSGPSQTAIRLLCVCWFNLLKQKWPLEFPSWSKNKRKNTKDLSYWLYIFIAS